MNAPEDALAGILAEHVLHGDEDGGVCMVLGGFEPCPHGWVMPEGAYEDDFGEERAHLAHVAQVLAEWVAGEKARAWDEGASFVASSPTGLDRKTWTRPYRLDPKDTP